MNQLAVGLLGALVLALAVGMPVWLTSLQPVVSATFGAPAAAQMHDGWLLVPLTAKFAFISPSKLVIAMPLLALAADRPRARIKRAGLRPRAGLVRRARTGSSRARRRPR